MPAAPYFLESANTDLRRPAAGVPLPCRRPMPVQTVAAWTPLSLLAALARTLLKLPRRAVPAAATLRDRRV